MSQATRHSSAAHESKDAGFKLYTIGFILSILLTVVPYFVVTQHIFAAGTVAAIISILAIAQLLVQLVFFLHLDDEVRPRWNLTALIFAVIVVAILAGGSLWIMNNLTYNGMSAHDLNKYIQDQEAIHK